MNAARVLAVVGGGVTMTEQDSPQAEIKRRPLGQPMQAEKKQTPEPISFGDFLMKVGPSQWRMVTGARSASNVARSASKVLCALPSELRICSMASAVFFAPISLMICRCNTLMFHVVARASPPWRPLCFLPHANGLQPELTPC